VPAIGRSWINRKKKDMKIIIIIICNSDAYLKNIPAVSPTVRVEKIRQLLETYPWLDVRRFDAILLLVLILPGEMKLVASH
jgi:hypothetical protein